MVEICEHLDFEAAVDVGRLTNAEGRIANYTAEVRVHCRKCKRRFQFLGLQPGVDLQGARMSIDGLEARLAICPQGEQPSPLDNIAVNFRGPGLTQ